MDSKIYESPKVLYEGQLEVQAGSEIESELFNNLLADFD